MIKVALYLAAVILVVTGASPAPQDDAEPSYAQFWHKGDEAYSANLPFPEEFLA